MPNARELEHFRRGVASTKRLSFVRLCAIPCSDPVQGRVVQLKSGHPGLCAAGKATPAVTLASADEPDLNHSQRKGDYAARLLRSAISSVSAPGVVTGREQV